MRLLKVPENPFSEIVPAGEPTAFAHLDDRLAILVELIFKIGVLLLKTSNVLVNLVESPLVHRKLRINLLGLYEEEYRN